MLNRSEILKALRSETQFVDWDVVYESELGRIYNYFLYKLCNREVAQDLTAVTFERAWKARSKYNTKLASLGLALAITPAVRAAVTDIIKTNIVRGTTVWISDDVPAVKGEGETYSEIWTPVHPSETSDFAKLPTWIPVGYLLQERAALFASVNQEEQAYSALFEWKNKHGNSLQLKVSKGTCPNGELWESGARRSDCGCMMYVEVGSDYQPEMIMIHNQPALLFPDFQILMDLSDPIQAWNPYRVKYDNRDPEAFFLIWESNGMTFEIAMKSPTIWKQDLIRIAESIP